MLIIFLPVLVFVLLFLNYIFAPYKPEAEKLSIYECGYSTVYGQTRSTFHINFYIVAMLFLVFDLEVLLIIPIALALPQVGLYGFSIALIFFFILTIGFILEIGSNALKISNSQSNSSKI